MFMSWPEYWLCFSFGSEYFLLEVGVIWLPWLGLCGLGVGYGYAPGDLFRNRYVDG